MLQSTGRECSILVLQCKPNVSSWVFVGHCLVSLLETSFVVLVGNNSVTADHVVRLIGVGSDLEPDLPQYQ